MIYRVYRCSRGHRTPKSIQNNDFDLSDRFLMVSISQDEDLGGLSGLATSVLISRSELDIKSDFRYRVSNSNRL
jgi:hypothetical protein